jgi:hypothetical protein
VRDGDRSRSERELGFPDSQAVGRAAASNARLRPRRPGGLGDRGAGVEGGRLSLPPAAIVPRAPPHLMKTARRDPSAYEPGSYPATTRAMVSLCGAHLRRAELLRAPEDPHCAFLWCTHVVTSTSGYLS